MLLHATTKPAIHTTLNHKTMYGLPYFFCLGGGEPITTAFRLLETWSVPPACQRMMRGPTTSSCNIVCHNHYKDMEIL